MKDKLKVFGITGIMAFMIYLIATNLRKQELKDIDFINQNYNLTKGVIIKKIFAKRKSY